MTAFLPDDDLTRLAYARDVDELDETAELDAVRLNPELEDLACGRPRRDGTGFDDDGDTYRPPGQPAGVRVRAPRLNDVAEYLEELAPAAREQRRAARRYGRPYAVPDARGVRGEQFAPIPDLDTQLELLRSGQDSVLAPYYSELGIGLDQPLLTTSWVHNVAFSAEIRSGGPRIDTGLLRPERRVTRADDPLALTVMPSGRLTNGGEFAVFSYELGAGQRVRSSVRTKLEVTLRAQFTHGDTTVVKDLDAKQLGLTLDMAQVHPLLMSNSDNGRPVTTPSNDIVVQKSGQQLPFAPEAVVIKQPAVYTFRYRPSENSWLLTRLQFSLLRSQLQGVTDDTQARYFDPQWEVDGQPLDQRLVSALVIEDPASSPLDPQMYIEVFPLRSINSVAGLPLLPGQSHRVSIGVTSNLVPRSLRTDPATGRRVPVQTIYTPLPSLDIFLPDAQVLMAAAPRIGSPAIYRVQVPRADKAARENFSSSELTLNSAPVQFTMLPSVQPDTGLDTFSAYEIVSCAIGPFRASALQEALDDARSRV